MSKASSLSTPSPARLPSAPARRPAAVAQPRVLVINPEDPDEVIDGQVTLLLSAAAKLVNIVYANGGENYDRASL